MNLSLEWAAKYRLRHAQYVHRFLVFDGLATARFNEKTRHDALRVGSAHHATLPAGIKVDFVLFCFVMEARGEVGRVSWERRLQWIRHSRNFLRKGCRYPRCRRLDTELGLICRHHCL